MTVDASIRSIWEHGWTHSALDHAIRTLAENLSDPPAAELLRRIAFRRAVDPDELMKWLEEERPLSPSTPQWDWLDAMLIRARRSTPVLIGELIAYGRDPVAALIEFLNEVAPRGINWRNAEESRSVQVHRHAYETLIELGTLESLTWVLSRLDLFDWEPAPEWARVVQPRREIFRAAAHQLWTALTWRERAEVAAFLSIYALDSQFVAMLIDVDDVALSVDERALYVRALGETFHPSAVPRLGELLDKALECLAQTPTPQGKAVVKAAVRALEWLDAKPSDEQRSRVRALLFR